MAKLLSKRMSRAWDPDLKKMVDEVVDWMTNTDEIQRQTRVDYVLSKLPVAVRPHLCRRLVEMLNCQSETRRRDAEDLLVALGTVALTSVRVAFFKRKGARVKSRLADVLGRIGATLPVPQRLEIVGDLEVALRRVPDAEAGAAILHAMDRLFPDSGSRRLAFLEAEAEMALASAHQTRPSQRICQ